MNVEIIVGKVITSPNWVHPTAVTVTAVGEQYFLGRYASTSGVMVEEVYSLADSWSAWLDTPRRVAIDVTLVRRIPRNGDIYVSVNSAPGALLVGNGDNNEVRDCLLRINNYEWTPT